MPNANQVAIDQEASEFTCKPCSNRRFVSLRSLVQHCQQADVHRGEWCGRCQRLFVSSNALQAHERDSQAHWLCAYCNCDELSYDQLINHELDDHHICRECNCKFDNYTAHRIRRHNRCRHCDREFRNQNELVMHKQVHNKRNKKCYGCDRMFASVSSIFIHLESGNCASRVTEEELKDWAYKSPQSHVFPDLYFGTFCCPECRVEFSHISGFLQHVESPACDAAYNGGIEKLRKYLANKTALHDFDGESATSYSSSAGFWW